MESMEAELRKAKHLVAHEASRLYSDLFQALQREPFVALHCQNQGNYFLLLQDLARRYCGPVSFFQHDVLLYNIRNLFHFTDCESHGQATEEPEVSRSAQGKGTVLSGSCCHSHSFLSIYFIIFYRILTTHPP